MSEAPFRIDQLPSRTPLRLALVTETYPPEINGVAMTTGRMVEGLLRRKHQIQLIRPRQRPNDAPAQRGVFEEVLAHGLPIPHYGELKMGLPAKHRLVRLWSVRRPDVVHVVTEGPLDQFSFPSGHTLHAVSFATVACAHFPELAPLLLPFALLVAASRPSLGPHYPSDVLAGASIGLALAFSLLAI
jgi:hypothetical protein